MAIAMHYLLIPSDNLVQLRELISHNPQLATMVGIPFQVRLVIDTNCVLEELLWLVGKRQNPSARTSLQEAIDTETVIAFVPEKLRVEVERHLPRLAQERGIPEDRLWQEWQMYQKYLRFCDIEIIPTDFDDPISDPDDLPFIALQHQVGALAIVSRDHHIAMMGGSSVNREIAIQLRDYARAKSGELTIKVGVYSITLMVTGSATVAVELLATLARSFTRLPLWLQLVLLGGIAIVALHPHSRQVAVELLRKVPHGLEIFFAEIDPILKTFGTESAKAADALKHIQQTLPPIHRIPLEIIAVSVCLAAEESLPLKEIARRVLASGYPSRSPHFEAYLSRVIRSSPRFAREADGGWRVTELQVRD